MYTCSMAGPDGPGIGVHYRVQTTAATVNIQKMGPPYQKAAMFQVLYPKCPQKERHLNWFIVLQSEHNSLKSAGKEMSVFSSE